MAQCCPPTGKGWDPFPEFNKAIVPSQILSVSVLFLRERQGPASAGEQGAAS